MESRLDDFQRYHYQWLSFTASRSSEATGLLSPNAGGGGGKRAALSQFASEVPRTILLGTMGSRVTDQNLSAGRELEWLPNVCINTLC